MLPFRIAVLTVHTTKTIQNPRYRAHGWPLAFWSHGICKSHDWRLATTSSTPADGDGIRSRGSGLLPTMRRRRGSSPCDIRPAAIHCLDFWSNTQLCSANQFCSLKTLQCDMLQGNLICINTSNISNLDVCEIWATMCLAQPLGIVCWTAITVITTNPLKSKGCRLATATKFPVSWR